MAQQSSSHLHPDSHQHHNRLLFLYIYTHDNLNRYNVVIQHRYNRVAPICLYKYGRQGKVESLSIYMLTTRRRMKRAPPLGGGGVMLGYLCGTLDGVWRGWTLLLSLHMPREEGLVLTKIKKLECNVFPVCWKSCSKKCWDLEMSQKLYPLTFIFSFYRIILYYYISI